MSLSPDIIIEREQRETGREIQLLSCQAFEHRKNVAMFAVYETASDPIDGVGVMHTLRFAVYIDGPQPSRTGGIVETWFER